MRLSGVKALDPLDPAKPRLFRSGLHLALNLALPRSLSSTMSVYWASSPYLIASLSGDISIAVGSGL